ncbi:MAG TPA: metabolite traffic protein EboE [Candidatus Angelobacter sp.]|nr:metabolite traffic protein EboE [Candidatus Angelobacter sp.]
MRIGSTAAHLSYCTNIHAAQGWSEVFDNIEHYAPAVKRHVCLDQPFALGLRLSDAEASELLEGSRLDDFAQFLSQHGLYVPLLNGFPFGAFHGSPVKEGVFAPDWSQPSRLEYTLRLSNILRRLLPPGMEGSISTVPIAYKYQVVANEQAVCLEAAHNLAKSVIHLSRMRNEQGVWIHIDLEPEPDGVIGRTAEAVEFFEKYLRPHGIPVLRQAMGIGKDRAAELLADHIGVCLDACHMAVEYESGEEAFDRLERSGIRTGRIQLSSAFDVSLPSDPGQRTTAAARLSEFADGCYLHQTRARDCNGGIHGFPDLEPALQSIHDTQLTELRVHFHVPLFEDMAGSIHSTQTYTRELLQLAVKRQITRHFEIETYTWGVLPSSMQTELTDSIACEYQWVLAQLAGPPVSWGKGK